MTVGINLDGRHFAGSPSHSKLVGCKFTGARLLSSSDNWLYTQNVLKGSAPRIEVMAIVTDESHGYILPQADILQIGNEADLSEPAPDHMSVSEYVRLWERYTNTYRYLGKQFYTCGFASGDPTYFAEFMWYVNSWGLCEPDAVAVHPYLKTDSEARDLLDAYWNVTGYIPVVVTEWYTDPGQGQIWAMQNMLDGDGGDGQGPRASVWNSWFCWSDGMVDKFGLVTANQIPKSTGDELVSALGGHF